MIIGFTTKTSSLLSKIFCRNLRHCIVIFDNDETDNYILIQIALDGIKLIMIDYGGIEKLRRAGWIFIEVSGTPSPTRRLYPTMLTCVGFAKRALGINNPLIWTPDQLYKYLTK